MSNVQEINVLLPKWISKTDPRKASQQLRRWRKKRFREGRMWAAEWWLIDADPELCSDEDIARNGLLVDRVLAGLPGWDTNAHYRRLNEWREAQRAA